MYRGELGSAGEIGMTVLFPDMAPDHFRMEHSTSRKYVTQKIVAAIADPRADAAGACSQRFTISSANSRKT